MESANDGFFNPITDTTSNKCILTDPLSSFTYVQLTFSKPVVFNTIWIVQLEDAGYETSIQGSTLYAGLPLNSNTIYQDFVPCGVNPPGHGLYYCKNIVGTMIQLKKPTGVPLGICEI